MLTPEQEYEILKRSENRDFKGVFMPKELWLTQDFTWTEKVILMEISYLDNEDHCTASNSYLSIFAQCSERLVSQAIALFKKLNIIEIVNFDGRYRTMSLASDWLDKVKSYKKPDKLNLSCKKCKPNEINETPNEGCKICSSELQKTQTINNSNNINNLLSSKSNELDLSDNKAFVERMGENSDNLNNIESIEHIKEESKNSTSAEPLVYSEGTQEITSQPSAQTDVTELQNEVDEINNLDLLKQVQKPKHKKGTKKESMFSKCCKAIIDRGYSEEVKDALITYLKSRVTYAPTNEVQFSGILDKLDEATAKLPTKDVKCVSAVQLKMIQNATNNSWRSLFELKDQDIAFILHNNGFHNGHVSNDVGSSNINQTDKPKNKIGRVDPSTLARNEDGSLMVF